MDERDEKTKNEDLSEEPEIDKAKVRIAGRFIVEALPAPVVKPLDGISAKQTDWRDQLRAAGMFDCGGSRLEFADVGPSSSRQKRKPRKQIPVAMHGFIGKRDKYAGSIKNSNFTSLFFYVITAL